MQALVRVFGEHGSTMKLSHMLTLVNKVVAYDFESCTDDEFTSCMKQVPCIVSTLTKMLKIIAQLLKITDHFCIIMCTYRMKQVPCGQHAHQTV